ncbi:hypothetical protein J4Q44_G00262440 [Coregonus suidteri]|uniref:Uncharacterized protein n=1 Tax=Coregonus suidteri TaxID=861788 RepID=A0AAN8LD05_9TELE
MGMEPSQWPTPLPMEGPHSLVVKYADEDEFCSPFNLHVKPSNDANKLKVSTPVLESGVCAKIPQTFTIDYSKTGEVPEAVAVMTTSGKMELLDVTDNGDGTYLVAYSPSMEGSHSLVVKYVDEDEFCSLSNFQVLPTNQANKLKVSGLESGICVKTPQTFTIDCSKTGEAPESVAVMTPSGKMELVEVTDNGDGTYSVAYSPSMEGPHSLVVKYADENEFSRLQTMTWTQDVMGSSPNGSKKLLTEMASLRAPADVTDNRDGTVTLMYDPTEEGLHQMHIKVDGTALPESPLQFYVNNASNSDTMAHGAGLVYSMTNKIAAFTIFNKDSTHCKLDISLEGPSKAEIRLMNNTVSGDYSILVRHNNEHITGSPFTARIAMAGEGLDVSCLLKRQPDRHIGISFIPKELEITDPRRVKVFGPGLVTGRTFEMSDFVVDTRDAGYGGLTLAIEGPSTVEVQTEEMEDGFCVISFCPTEPGAYTLSVKFAEEHVPGSQFTAEVTESGYVRESITHFQGAATIASVGNAWTPSTYLPMSPSGAIEEADVTGSVSFVPSEMGVHAVSVRYKGQQIPGSPYQYTVGPLGEGGPENVQAWGLGLQSAEASIPADFSIWTREAGARSLSVTMEGPGQAELTFEDREDGSCGISYVALEPGDYEVSVKFDDKHIQDSPYLVPVYGPAGDDASGSGQTKGNLMRRVINGCLASSLWSSFQSDACKVVSSGPGLNEACLGRRNIFNVDCSKAGINLFLVGMHGPTMPCEEVSIKHLGKETGSYILAVKLEEEHIPGSPPFNVIAS